MSDLSLPELRELREAAESIARETRALVLSALSGDLKERLKPDDSFVTDVDLAVEDLIRTRLTARFPGHGIVGEERADVRAESDFRWVIDPVDGTHSLRHRIPLFGTLLALQYRGRTRVGLIDLPALGRSYVAASGLGAQRDGRPLRITDLASPDLVRHEVVAIGERKQFVRADSEEVFDRLMRAHGSVRTYCDCFGHALAVEGSVGAMIDYGLRLWDIAPTQVLIAEAGGKSVRLRRARGTPEQPELYDVVFGKPTVVDWVLRTIDASPGDDEG